LSYNQFAKNTIWPNYATSSHQNQRIRGAGDEEPPAALGDFRKFVPRAKMQPKNQNLYVISLAVRCNIRLDGGFSLCLRFCL